MDRKPRLTLEHLLMKESDLSEMSVAQKLDCKNKYGIDLDSEGGLEQFNDHAKLVVAGLKDTISKVKGNRGGNP